MHVPNENTAGLQSGVRSDVLTYPWMFGRSYDTLFFFFPLLIGIFCFSLSQNSAIASSAFWMFLALDAFGAGPFHFGPTWFAYYDKKNREYWGSLPSKRIIFFVAPILLMLGTTLIFMTVFGVVEIVLTLWAIQHVVQQNVGILLLYHNQGKGEAIVDRKLEMQSQQFPAVLFTLIFIWRIFLLAPKNVGVGIFFAVVTLWAARPVVLYLLDLRKQVKAGAKINVPALAFWTISITTLIPFAFLGKTFAEAWVIPVTVHWFQYIGLNYAMVKSKYAANSPLLSDMPKQVRPMVLFLSTCVTLFAMAFLIMFVGQEVFKSNVFMTKLLTGIWLGVTACHYFLDAFLWRFREAHARQSILPHLLSYRKAPSQS